MVCLVLIAESRNRQMLMFDYTGIAVRLESSDNLGQPLQLVLKVCQLTPCMLSIARPNVMKQTIS